MNKKHLIVFCLAVVLLLSFFISSGHAGKDVEGKTFYTAVNIWYEQPEKIYTTNYHRGAILPAGTKVTIKDIDSKEIVFDDQDKVRYKIIYLEQHSPGVSLRDHFDRYFTEMDPMRSGGPFEKFTKSERDAITTGVIVEGMRKEAVLMSYGYPPSIGTHSLESGAWKYWQNRFRSILVQFKDNKISKIGR
jgi:hypothetical protein